MKKQLVLFGIGKMADVISYYAKEECGFDVVAFAVDRKYMTDGKFNNLPVVAFEDVEKIYPPAQFDFFVAVGYQDLNKLREEKCQEAQQKGYKLVSIVSPRANVPSNVKIGWNTFIMPPSLIHPCVVIGNNVFVWSGAMVAHHSVIDDHCWLTSCCNISGNVHIGANTFVAVNATIGHSVTIGKRCFLGANTLITKNVDDEKVIIEESSKTLRLSSSQFLRMSSFTNL